MDLMSARVEAAVMSNKGGKPAYVILVEDEFEATHTPEPGADIYARYVRGGEDKEFLESMQPDTAATESKPAAKKEAKKANINKTNNMETTTKKTAKKATKKAPATKKAAKKAPAKKAVKKAPAKKAAAKKAAPAKKAASNGGKKVRSIYGFGIELLEMLKKGGAHPMEALTKKFKVDNAAVSFQIAAIKSHGYKVERTDKGYRLIK